MQGRNPEFILPLIFSYAPTILILFGCIEYFINTRSLAAALMLVGNAVGLGLNVITMMLAMGRTSGGPVLPYGMLVFRYGTIIAQFGFAAGFLWMALRSAKREEVYVPPTVEKPGEPGSGENA